MKDAYSFHLDSASLDEWYEIYKIAYNKIFNRLGLETQWLMLIVETLVGANQMNFM